MGSSRFNVNQLINAPPTGMTGNETSPPVNGSVAPAWIWIWIWKVVASLHNITATIYCRRHAQSVQHTKTQPEI